MLKSATFRQLLLYIYVLNQFVRGTATSCQISHLLFPDYPRPLLDYETHKQVNRVTATCSRRFLSGERLLEYARRENELLISCFSEIVGQCDKLFFL